MLLVGSLKESKFCACVCERENNISRMSMNANIKDFSRKEILKYISGFRVALPKDLSLSFNTAVFPRVAHQ